MVLQFLTIILFYITWYTYHMTQLSPFLGISQGNGTSLHLSTPKCVGDDTWLG